MGVREVGVRFGDASARWCLNLKLPITLFDVMLDALEAARAERQGATTHEAG